MTTASQKEIPCLPFACFFFGFQASKNRNFLEMKWWMKIGISKKGGEFSPPYFKNFFWYILIYLVPSEKREPTNWMNWTAENLRSICQPHWMFLFHELNTHKARLARSVVHHLLHAPLPLGHPRRGLRDSQIWPKKRWESRCGKKKQEAIVGSRSKLVWPIFLFVWRKWDSNKLYREAMVPMKWDRNILVIPLMKRVPQRSRTRGW